MIPRGEEYVEHESGVQVPETTQFMKENKQENRCMICHRETKVLRDQPEDDKNFPDAKRLNEYNRYCGKCDLVWYKDACVE